MSEQKTYDRAIDAPATPVPVQPGVALPNEGYYQRAPDSRRSGRRGGLGIVLVLVGLLLLAFQIFGHGSAFGNGSNITVADQTLPGNRIELNVAASDVEVRPWEQNTIHVEAIQHGGSQGDYTVDVSQSGDTVRVAESSRSFFCWFCSHNVSYRISVPSGAQTDIHTASGEIDVAGLNGPVTLASVSGDVQANDLTGGLTASSTSGEIRLKAITGPLDITTISGDVRLEDGNVNGVTAKTTSGDLNLAGVAGALNLSSVSGDISVSDARDAQLTVSTTSGGVDYDGSLARNSTSQLNSISGDVKLQLPEDSSFRLDASTVSGDLKNEFNLSGDQPGRGSLSGVAGDGSATLTVETTSGEIQIERR